MHPKSLSIVDDDVPLLPSDTLPAESSNAFTILLNSGRQPANFVTARLRDADNLCHSSSSTRKRVLSGAVDPPRAKRATMGALNPESSSLEVVADIIAWWGLDSFIAVSNTARIACDYLPI
ncbi:hypothetical protein AZE42_10268 [Rhizopogon vesiculosus]|uniref:Uncharacterized protein n=1 Tax=Rhizopogon vesiculosus TaxID=180088 RepID=A0A1J8QM85_9AGAM|nr:hypothetical protein AZE42_10268 [Rhizopogon vesiculosus]